MKISKHAQKRMRERTTLNHAERRKLFNEALHKGLTPNDIQDQGFRNYLLFKQARCKIKIYKGYIFIHSKNGGQLYTMYEIPRKWRNSYDKSSGNTKLSTTC